MLSASVAREWLPEPEAEKARQDQPVTFQRTLKAIQDAWERDVDNTVEYRLFHMCNWMTAAKRLAKSRRKADIPQSDINWGLELLLDIFTSSLDSQLSLWDKARWAKILQLYLSTFRNKISGTIPWRPLYSVLLRLSQGQFSQHFTGQVTFISAAQELIHLTENARRFFPQGSVKEIWDELKTQLTQTHQIDAIYAVGWLHIMLPTRELLHATEHDSPFWNQFATDAMDIWDSMMHVDFWDTAWTCILARVAKHDRHGLINWNPLLPRLYTHLLWTFRVPVGTASESPPFGKPSIKRAEYFFGRLGKRVSATSKICIWLLRRCGADPNSSQEDFALVSLERLGRLLEQYYHPSNHGKWSKALGDFLQDLSHHLGKWAKIRRAAEQGVDAYVSDEDEAETEAAANGRQLGNSTAPMNGATDTVMDDSAAEQIEKRVAHVILKLATKAQFAKDSSLAEIACDTLARTAFWIPEVALPIISKNFEMALEAVTASRQLVSAIQALMYAVRPMLLVGFSPSDSDTASSHPQAVASQAIAACMQLTLPGIDANDEAKTNQVFRLYAVIFTTIGMFEEGEGHLPLFTEDWLDGFLNQIFTILVNVDSQQTRMDVAAQESGPAPSFLVAFDCMFTPVVQFLIARLPDQLRLWAMKRLASFMQTTSLRAGSELSVICKAFSCCAPEETLRLILVPLLDRLDSDYLIPFLQSKAQDPSLQLSKGQAGTVKTILIVVEASLSKLGSHILTMQARITKLLDQLFGLGSKDIADAAAHLLRTVFLALLSYYPKDWAKPGPYMDTRTEGCKMEEWINFQQLRRKKDVSRLAPTWHLPSVDEIAFGQQLLDKFLTGACRQLKDLCQNGQEPQKEVILSILAQIMECICLSAIPDLQLAKNPLAGESLAIQAQEMVSLGDATLRQEAATVLLQAAQRNFSDPAVRTRILSVMKHLFQREQYKTQIPRREGLSKDLGVLHDLPEFYLLSGEEGRWRKKLPRPLAVLSTWTELVDRSSDAIATRHLTSLHPSIPFDAVPPIIKDLAAETLMQCLQPYAEVSRAASSVLESIFQKYECLIPNVLPAFIAAVGGIEVLSREEVRSSLDREITFGTDRIIESSLLDRLHSRLQQLRETSVASISAADMRAEESRVRASIAVMWQFLPFGDIGRDPSLLAALVMALLAGLSHQSPKTIQEVYNANVKLILRFETTPRLQSNEVKGDSAVEGLFSILNTLGRSDSDQHWKVKAAANLWLIVLRSPQSVAEAEELTSHFLALLHNSLPLLRDTAGLYFAFILNSQRPQTKEITDKAAEVVRTTIQANSAWVSSFLELQSHTHPARPASQEAGGYKARPVNADSMLTELLSGGLEREVPWPNGRPAPSAVADGSFSISNVRILKALIDLVPLELEACLKPYLVKSMADMNDSGARPVTLTAIEAFSALISCGHIFRANDNGSSSWNDWVRPLLKQALSNANLDFGDAWACAVRYSLHGLAKSDANAVEEFLTFIQSYDIPDDETQATMVRLKCFTHLAAELTSLDVIGTAAYDPTTSPVKAAGQKFQCHILRELPKLASTGGEDTRRHFASLGSVVLGSVLRQPSKGTIAAQAENSHSMLEELAENATKFLVKSVEEGANFVAELEKQHTQSDASMENGLENGEVSQSLLETPEIAKLGAALRIVQQALRGAERLCAVQLQPVLIQMLPHVIRLQEIATPELSMLALEAKTALSYLKYILFTPEDVESVLTALIDASNLEQWWCRAAALVVMQYFWFRSNFLMSADQAARCQEMVMKLLHDSKLRIQEPAADTLSGLLKGLSEEAFQSLRADLLDQFEKLAPRKKGLKSAKTTGPPAPVEDLHALVLALKAFVLSTPYDVPTWLPDVLMALSRVAGRPNPVKASVRKTISEFKRTHEETGMNDFRRMLTEEQWEALQGIAAPASYFA